MGGYSSEYDISMKSGDVVFQYLPRDYFIPYRVLIRKEGWVLWGEDGKEYPVNRHDFTVDLGTEILQFDCVFNAIHGSPGEDGYMHAYFELIGLPHTSCGFYQAALTFNKRDLLSALRPFGIKSADSYYLNMGDPIDTSKIVAKVGLPCFVKANRSGSSYGMSKVYHESELPAALEKAFKEDDELIIETFLDGTEVSVGVIRYKGKTTILPITEIIPENDFFDYQAKYEGKSQEITPARLSPLREEKVRLAARTAYEALGMRGYSRSEFIFQGDEPYMLEMNTTPGLTEESLLPQQAKAAGISLPELFKSAIEEALADFD